MLSLGIRHGLTTEWERSRLVCSLWNFSGIALWNSRQAEALAAALRVAAASSSRRAEALTVEAASEPEKAICRRARACSPVLAALLTAQLAELLRERAAEIFAEHFAERSPELPVYRVRPTRLAVFVCGS